MYKEYDSKDTNNTKTPSPYVEDYAYNEQYQQSKFEHSNDNDD